MKTSWQNTGWTFAGCALIGTVGGFVAHALWAAVICGALGCAIVAAGDAASLTRRE